MFNNDFEDNYSRIKSLFPSWYTNIFEMDCIWRSQGKNLDEMRDSLKKIVDNNFIETSDKETIERLERFFYLETNNSRPLDERKRIVMAYYTGFGKISASKINEMIYTMTKSTSCCKFEPIDDMGNNGLLITIERTIPIFKGIEDIRGLLERKLPAHIYFDITIASYVTAKSELFTASKIIGKKKYIKGEVNEYGGVE